MALVTRSRGICEEQCPHAGAGDRSPLVTMPLLHGAFVAASALGPGVVLLQRHDKISPRKVPVCPRCQIKKP